MFLAWELGGEHGDTPQLPVQDVKQKWPWTAGDPLCMCSQEAKVSSGSHQVEGLDLALPHHRAGGLLHFSYNRVCHPFRVKDGAPSHHCVCVKSGGNHSYSFPFPQVWTLSM